MYRRVCRWQLLVFTDYRGSHIEKNTALHHHPPPAPQKNIKKNKWRDFNSTEISTIVATLCCTLIKWQDTVYIVAHSSCFNSVLYKCCVQIELNKINACTFLCNFIIPCLLCFSMQISAVFRFCKCNKYNSTQVVDMLCKSNYVLKRDCKWIDVCSKLASSGIVCNSKVTSWFKAVA